MTAHQADQFAETESRRCPGCGHPKGQCDGTGNLCYLPPPHAEYIALNVEAFEGSCDGCAEGDKQIVHVDPDTEAYICDECVANEEKAIQAAAEAILRQWHRKDAPVEYANRLARIAVNAYVQAKWRADQFDGEADA